MSFINNKKSLVYSTIAAISVFAVFCVLLFNSTPKVTEKPKETSEYEYIVTVKDIKKGDVITEDDIEIKDLKMEMTGAYQKKADVIGRNADQEIKAGVPIIKNFLKAIEINNTVNVEPKNGFRAVPLLIKASAMPPYVSTNQLYDLFTRENSMKVENLKILSILDSKSGDGNKILILEIKNSDVSSFIDNQVATSGFIFVQKNPDEYGEYKFSSSKKNLNKDANFSEMPAKLPDDAYLPPISDVMNNQPGISEPAVDYTNKKEVEIIVGNTKTKMEFEE